MRVVHECPLNPKRKEGAFRGPGEQTQLEEC